MSGAEVNAAPLFQGNAQAAPLDPAMIFVPERIGFYHPDKAAALGRLMAVDGQNDPIKVTRMNAALRKQAAAAGQEKCEWALVVGLHRLRGAEIEGLHIWALEVQGSADALTQMEASENIHRRNFAPLERAKFVWALMEAAKARIAAEHGDLTQQEMGAKARWGRVRAGIDRAEAALDDDAAYAAANFAAAYSWKESVTLALGLSERSIRLDLSRYRLLIEPFPDQAEALSAHPIVGNNASELRQLESIVSDKARGEAITQLLLDPSMSAAEAKVAVGITNVPDATPLAHQKHMDAIQSGFSRLTLNQQRDFLPSFASGLKPSLKRLLLDTLKAELEE